MAKRGDSSTLCWRFIHFYGRYSNYIFLLIEYRLVSFCLLNLPLRYFASLRHPLLCITDLRFISIIAAKTCLRQSTSNRLSMNRAQNWDPHFVQWSSFFKLHMPIPFPNLTYKVQPVSFPDIQHCTGRKGGTPKHLINNSTALGSYSKTNGMNVPGSFCPGLSELLVVLVLYFSTLS